MEYEGVVVEETTAFHHQAWRQLAEEEGKPAPLQWALKRASGMKAEQVCPIAHRWEVPCACELLFVAGFSLQRSTNLAVCTEALCSPAAVRQDAGSLY